MSTDNESPISPELLTSAASLLRVGVSAFDEDGEPRGDTDLDDILEVVQIAKARILEWLTEISGEDGSGAFDALDLLTLAQTAIVSGLDLSGLQTISPIRAAMKMAAEALKRAVKDNQRGPSDAEREAA